MHLKGNSQGLGITRGLVPQNTKCDGAGMSVCKEGIRADHVSTVGRKVRHRGSGEGKEDNEKLTHLVHPIEMEGLPLFFKDVYLL